MGLIKLEKTIKERNIHNLKKSLEHAVAGKIAGFAVPPEVGKVLVIRNILARDISARTAFILYHNIEVNRDKVVMPDNFRDQYLPDGRLLITDPEDKQHCIFELDAVVDGDGGILVRGYEAKYQEAFAQEQGIILRDAIINRMLNGGNFVEATEEGEPDDSPEGE